ncbi:hypothetical protein BJ965_003302 [Streptomyces luteogriseus]|uniref:Uncharacterized protein n=1 Tax=Streptomyces luteogriseus TaxID=68233 RepID=A0A7W7GJV2_9ACTN|nr:hypothetical protein [Streptomyces luteogriseus]
MIGLRGGGDAFWKSSRVEICIAVADWARGLMTWVLDVPGGEGTDARRRTLRKRVRHRTGRVNRSGPPDVLNARWTIFGPGAAGMVVGWG